MKIFENEICLEDETVLLKPVSTADIDGYCQIALDKEIWSYTTTKLSTRKDVEQFVKKGIRERVAKKRLMFTIFSQKDHTLLGSSSFGNISEKDKRLEIGWTWLGKAYQGKGINGACKRLLLGYAFDVAGVERVEFKTDALNKQSRKALAKIGCSEEGILRSHTLMHDGRRRDTVYYSILKSEYEQRS